MSNFVTSTGLVLPTLAEIKTQLETDFQASFGADIDISPEGPFGQFIALMSKSISDAYLAVQEVYTARHPNEATGTSLDNIAAETGIRRIDATATSVYDALLYGTEGTTVPAGSLIKTSTNTNTYELDAAATISIATASDIWLEPNDLTVGVDAEVTLNGTLYSYTVQLGDTALDIITEIYNSIVADTGGNFQVNGGIASIESGTYLRLYSTVLYSCTFDKFDLFKLATAGDFTCTTTGPNSAPANSLTVITTPVSGWESVINPTAGFTGRATETDAELRIRRSSVLNAGSATEESIRAQLLNSIEGVTAAIVSSNRTLVTDGEGRPPKSFEAIVDGGTDADVALTIWTHMPAGILTYGSTTETIVDSQGQPQYINFSRPTQKYLHVKVKRSLYSEEVYPTDGDEAIKQAIVDWSLTAYSLGTDVIYQRLITPVYTIDGIESVEITVDLTDAPGDTPTFAAANIPVASREFVVAAISRITVEAL